VFGNELNAFCWILIQTDCNLTFWFPKSVAWPLHTRNLNATSGSSSSHASGTWRYLNMASPTTSLPSRRLTYILLFRRCPSWPTATCELRTEEYWRNTSGTTPHFSLLHDMWNGIFWGVSKRKDELELQSNSRNGMRSLTVTTNVLHSQVRHFKESKFATYRTPMNKEHRQKLSTLQQKTELHRHASTFFLFYSR